MAIIPWLDKHVHGDAGWVPDAKNLANQGGSAYASGGSTFDSGVAGMQNLDQSLTDKLNSGRVLPDSVYKAYGTLRGGINDTAARDQNSLVANLAQENAQSGGRMSPEALAELKATGDQSINDQQFSQLSGVGVDQANNELQQTNQLMDRISAARQSVINAGQFRQQLGQQAQFSSLLARLDRNKAIASTIASIVGGSMH